MNDSPSSAVQLGGLELLDGLLGPLQQHGLLRDVAEVHVLDHGGPLLRRIRARDQRQRPLLRHVVAHDRTDCLLELLVHSLQFGTERMEEGELVSGRECGDVIH